MRLLSSVLIFPLPKIASFYGTSNERVSLSPNGTADELPKRKIIAARREEVWELAIKNKQSLHIFKSAFSLEDKVNARTPCRVHSSKARE